MIWALILIIVALLWAHGKLFSELQNLQERFKETELQCGIWRATAQKVFQSHCNTLRLLWKAAAPDKNCPGCDTSGVILTEEGVSACPVCNGDPTTT